MLDSKTKSLTKVYSIRQWSRITHLSFQMGMWCSGNITAPEADDAGSIPVISTIKIDHLWCPNL
jgi:hypothetical protein